MSEIWTHLEHLEVFNLEEKMLFSRKCKTYILLSMRITVECFINIYGIFYFYHVFKMVWYISVVVLLVWSISFQ